MVLVRLNFNSGCVSTALRTVLKIIVLSDFLLILYCRFKNGNSIVANITTDSSTTVLKSDELAYNSPNWE
jgi:hypothetical protein